MALILFLVLSALFYYFYTYNYFFRFAVLPVIANSFTPEGYTLFSSKHLLDILNLLFLLIPPIVLFILALTKIQLKGISKNSDHLFLLITTIVTLSAVFLFDPKLGMPRDWDLFSYTGVPLTIMGFYVILDNRFNLKGASYIAIIAIFLGFLTLLPRTFAQIIPDTAKSNFKNYLTLDKTKSRPGWFILFQYLKDQGDITIAEQTRKDWLKLYPEAKIFDDAKVKLTSGRFQEAVDLNMRVIELNPIYHEAYANLGAALSQLNMEDSALKILEIARGLNPHNSSIWTNMGRIYLKKRMYPEAEDALLKAIDLKKESLTFLILARMHKKLEHYDKYHEYLVKAASQRSVMPAIIKELGDYYLLKKDFGKAATTYQNAVRKGLDKSIIDTIISVNPQLKEYYRER